MYICLQSILNAFLLTHYFYWQAFKNILSKVMNILYRLQRYIITFFLKILFVINFLCSKHTWILRENKK